MGGLFSTPQEEEKAETKQEVTEELVVDETKTTLENLEALGYIIHKESPDDFGKLR